MRARALCHPGQFLGFLRCHWDTCALIVALDPNKKWARLRPGPIISISAIGPAPHPRKNHPPKGALLHGHVFFAEDGRVVVRYREVELENGERVPICHAVVAENNRTVDVPDVRSRTENLVEAHSSQVANFFRMLPD